MKSKQKKKKNRVTVSQQETTGIYDVLNVPFVPPVAARSIKWGRQQPAVSSFTPTPITLCNFFL